MKLLDKNGSGSSGQQFGSHTQMHSPQAHKPAYKHTLLELTYTHAVAAWLAETVDMTFLSRKMPKLHTSMLSCPKQYRCNTPHHLKTEME